MSSPNSLQEYLADATQKTADALLSAVLNLPQDKRPWSPADKGRNAVDQLAECAIINGGVVQALNDPDAAAHYDMAGFDAAKSALANDWDTLITAFEANTMSLIAAIRAVPDSNLSNSIKLPWGSWTIAHLIGHPYWNMAYHEGQINYIASLVD